MEYDLIILGGGPAGYSTAASAGSLGLRVLLFEENSLGGVCLNEGCIPTKSLLYSAHLYTQILCASKLGITLSSAPTPDYKKIASRKSKIVRKLIAGIKAEMEHTNVEVKSAHARLSGSDGEYIRILSEGEHFLARNVLLCTGSDAFVPPIPGLSQVPYLTSREALALKELPESITIIGGGVIGIEFAEIYSCLGIPVTVIEMLPKILGPMDTELSEYLQRKLEKQGVRFYLHSQVKQVTPENIKVETSVGEELSLTYDHLLVSAGRVARVADIGLETLDIAYTPKGVTVDERMRTTHPSVYAAGDITGFSQFAHTAIREGEVALHHMLGKEDRIDYRAIPSIVYTDPEIASVGYTEEELSRESVPYSLISLPMTHSGRFVVENEGESGLFKLLISPQGKILGAHILGTPASEIIFALGLAIREGLGIDELKRQVYPHPTVGEIIHEALRKCPQSCS